MPAHRLLIVDDEKNIRLTLRQTLERADLDLGVETAADGEEALGALQKQDYDLVLLDIKMPGLSGIDVLRRVREVRPQVRIVMITAHGTIDNAVEAMKLGAVDFVKKPFSGKEIQQIVRQVLAREALRPEDAETYDEYIELARRGITHQDFETAAEYVQKAITLDEEQPAGHNLLGVLHEIRGDRAEAQQSYRRALELDPSYEPARSNVRQSVDPGEHGSFMLDEAKKPGGPPVGEQEHEEQ